MKKCKILKLFVLGFAVFMFYSMFDVNASGLPKACADDLNDECYGEVFGIDVVINSKAGKVKVNVGKNYSDEDGNLAVFRILKVNGNDVSSKNWTVKYGKPKNMNINISGKTMTIELQTTKKIKVKSGNETKTGKVRAVLTVTKSQSGSPDRVAGEDPGDLPDITVPQEEIKCDYINTDANYYSLNNFKDRFCYTKQKAIKKGGKYNQGKIPQNQDLANKEAFENKCSVDAKKITAEHNDDDDNLGGYNDQYYQNRRYYYAYTINEYNNLGKYRYNYYPGQNYSYPDDTLSCKLECQEAVIVEYGPPVASKAGLCFDYKVKVTSRVHCWIKEKPKKPRKPSGYCTPGPTCYHGGTKYRQGGPSEEFDQCIQECDGGKYTAKCSNSCYEKVYGKSVTTSSSVKPTVKKAVKTCASSSSYDGCYYRNKRNGSIYWYGRGGHDVYAPGRWYAKHPNSWGIAGHVYNVPYNDGFYRAKTPNGPCPDSCHWGGCDWNEYLNPGQDKIDYNANKEIYEKALAKCQEKAKCNTTTTEFQIAAQYNRDVDEDGHTENVVIHFPYSSTSDMVYPNGKVTDDINNPDKLSVCDSDNKSGDTDGNPNSTIRRFAGCYGETCPKDQIMYMTEWTFPGSWVNKKTGEISYSSVSKDKAGWRSKERKFCIPRDANTVNALWYQWYFHQVEKTDTSIYDGICLTAQAKEVINKTKYSDYKSDPNTYNIFAKAKKFGYFKWNFNIKCFYALDNGDNKDGDPTTVINENTKDKCQTNYRVRTVANTELFPTGAVTSNDSSQTRTKGYNWTNEASLKNQSDIPESYKVNPAEVQSTIQTNGDKIYIETPDDKYIDYQFKLSTQDLNNLKNYNSKVGAFGKFCGTFKQEPSSGSKGLTLTVYYSNILRGGEVDASCKDASLTLSHIKLGNPAVNNQ